MYGAATMFHFSFAYVEPSTLAADVAQHRPAVDCDCNATAHYPLVPGMCLARCGLTGCSYLMLGPSWFLPLQPRFEGWLQNAASHQSCNAVHGRAKIAFLLLRV